MSVIYYLVFSNGLYGYFTFGRFVDLFQMDSVVGLLIAILIFEVKRWKRLRDLDG